jgi:hypothetical protein
LNAWKCIIIVVIHITILNLRVVNGFWVMSYHACRTTLCDIINIFSNVAWVSSKIANSYYSVFTYVTVSLDRVVHRKRRMKKITFEVSKWLFLLFTNKERKELQSFPQILDFANSNGKLWSQSYNRKLQYYTSVVKLTYR